MRSLRLSRSPAGGGSRRCSGRCRLRPRAAERRRAEHAELHAARHGIALDRARELEGERHRLDDRELPGDVVAVHGAVENIRRAFLGRLRAFKLAARALEDELRLAFAHRRIHRDVPRAVGSHVDLAVRCGRFPTRQDVCAPRLLRPAGSSRRVPSTASRRIPGRDPGGGHCDGGLRVNADYNAPADRATGARHERPPFRPSTLIPALSWIRTYTTKNVRLDLIAGLSLAAFVIPESLAYASLAQLPPVTGLYCYLV